MGLRVGRHGDAQYGEIGLNDFDVHAEGDPMEHELRVGIRGDILPLQAHTRGNRTRRRDATPSALRAPLAKTRSSVRILV
jgi:hypothetical protein